MLYYFVTSFLKLYLTLFYRLKITGLENIPKGPAVIAANHTSYFDPPIIGSAFPEKIYYLAKPDLFKGIFGRLIESLGAYPIGTNAIKTATHLLKEGHKIVIFPEGERSSDGTLLPLKKGFHLLAAKTKSPILPVHISGAYEAFPRDQKWPRFTGRIEITIKPPISVDDPELVQKLTEALSR